VPERLPCRFLVPAGSSTWSDLFRFEIPPTEKVLRTVIVYLVIALLIRVAGKRTLAQLNSFDLVVILLLSNVVQNAIIGPDNSLLGGILGAVVLVGFNAVMDRVAFLGPVAEKVFEGSPTVLIRDGVVDAAALSRMGLRPHELDQVLHRQGADSPTEVRRADLQPAGSFTVDLRRTSRPPATASCMRSWPSCRPTSTGGSPSSRRA